MRRKILPGPIRLGDIANELKAELVGDGSKAVNGICSLDDLQPGFIAFSTEKSAAKLRKLISEVRANLGALIISNSVELETAGLGISILKVDDPMRAVLKLIPYFFEPIRIAPGISEQALVSSTAKIGKGTAIGPFCSIADQVVIGENVLIHPHVTIYSGAVIGANSVIHAGAVIREDCILGQNTVVQNGAVVGADGFGYIPDAELGLKAIPQVGRVRLADGVEIGANSCVDRATLGETQIGRGSKLDNLVQVGHNVSVGEFSILCAQVGIAGSSKVGNQVILGGGVGVADHLNIVDGCRFAARTGVVSHIVAKGDYAGFPAMPAAAWRRYIAKLLKLVGESRANKKLGKK